MSRKFEASYDVKSPSLQLRGFVMENNKQTQHNNLTHEKQAISKKRIKGEEIR